LISIRTRLLILVFVLLMPIVAGAIWGLLDLYQQQRANTRQNLQDVVRALSTVVASELSRREAMLQTLARSPALMNDDLAEFHRYAQMMAPAPDRTIVLTDLDGRQIVNSRLSFRSELLPRTSTTHQLRMKLGMGPQATVVSDLYFAPVGKRYSFAVQVPVWRDGKVTHYLAMGSYADTLQRLVVDPRLGEGWNAAIFDRQGVVVARRMEPERFVGRAGAADTIEHFKKAREGVLQTTRMDGSSAITAFHAVGDTGWTFVVSMPLDDFQQPLFRAISVTLFVTLASFALAILGALVASRRITRPLRDLATRAPSMVKSDEPPNLDYGLAEANMVAAALRKAGEEIQSVNRDLEKRVEAAVNEAKRVQEQLLQHQKLEALGRLTGGIAHDFNNLLQTISTSLQLIELKSLDPVVKRAVGSAQRAVGSGAALSRQLMTFGRVQTNQFATIHIPDEIKRMRELIMGALRRDIEVRTEFPDDTWAVSVDRIQFELALLNVCFNARDAMPGGGTLTLSTANKVIRKDEVRDLPAGDYVLLRIADTGQGIPQDIQDKVFDPFFTTKEVGRGSGLGLAQVYGFVRQARGAASIHSDERGTTVSLWFPREQRFAPEKEARSAARSIRMPNRRCRVLLVEDDARIREVLVPALENLGFETSVAYDAAAALAALKADPDIDVVFSDIVMPGGRSGIDLAHEINARYPAMPVVLSTGYSSTESSGYTTLLKPYDIRQLACVLLESCEQTSRV
jgi:signal transduction histidine kinase